MTREGGGEETGPSTRRQGLHSLLSTVKQISEEVV